MKKIMFVLALLVLAVPVWAQTDVVITCEQITPGEPNVAIGYIKTGDGHVRAFALDIVVTPNEGQPGAPVILEVDCVSGDYYIYPGSIDIDEDTGEVTDDGDCVCDDGQYPIDTLPGPPDSNGVTIEMGSLYDNVPPLDDPCHEDPPAASGTLVILKVDSESCITVTENILRGGIVLEDPQATIATLVLPDGNDCCVTGLDCFDSGDPKYGQWVIQHKPKAWCCDGQANGDADGNGSCNVLDLFAVKKAWGKTFAAGPWGTALGQYNCAADFDHNGTVNVLDLFVVKNNWGQVVGTACADITDCPSGP